MNQKLKNFLFGFATAFMLVLTVGGALAAIGLPGSTINVPAGKRIFYLFIDSQYDDEIQDAAQYWGNNETLTVTQGYVALNAQGTACLRDWIVAGNKNHDVIEYEKTIAGINPVE